MHADEEPEGAGSSTPSSSSSSGVPSPTAPAPAASGGSGDSMTTTTSIWQRDAPPPSADNALARRAPAPRLPPWQDRLPELVRRRRLRLRDETPRSARTLRDSVPGGHFVVEAGGDDGDDHGAMIPPDVEDTLFDAFVEDDYDGALHLTTIVLDGDDGGDDGGDVFVGGGGGADGGGAAATPLGIIFWREVPEEEMDEWIDRDGLAELARERRRRMLLDSGGGGGGIGTDGIIDADVQRRALPPPPGKREAEETWVGGDEPPGNDEGHGHPVGGLGDRMQRSLVAVRQESLGWLSRVDGLPPPTAREGRGVVSRGEDGVPADYAQAWIKIELLAVRREHWGRRIGSLLLACAMYRAWLRNGKRCVLHIAGGTSNVPAVRLYERFGFVPATPGLFRKPDKDVYVLGNIDLALRSLLWDETLEVPELPCQ